MYRKAISSLICFLSLASTAMTDELTAVDNLQGKCVFGVDAKKNLTVKSCDLTLTPPPPPPSTCSRSKSSLQTPPQSLPMPEALQESDEAVPEEEADDVAPGEEADEMVPGMAAEEETDEIIPGEVPEEEADENYEEEVPATLRSRVSTKKAKIASSRQSVPLVTEAEEETGEEEPGLVAPQASPAPAPKIKPAAKPVPALKVKPAVKLAPVPKAKPKAKPVLAPKLKQKAKPTPVPKIKTAAKPALAPIRPAPAPKLGLDPAPNKASVKNDVPVTAEEDTREDAPTPSAENDESLELELAPENETPPPLPGKLVLQPAGSKTSPPHAKKTGKQLYEEELDRINTGGKGVMAVALDAAERDVKEDFRRLEDAQENLEKIKAAAKKAELVEKRKQTS